VTTAATSYEAGLDLAEPLRRYFGFERFLPGQEEIVRSALAGRDTLALMPTGSGKSLPYQLAAMLRPSPTLVVSPLIALMKDQVDKLPREVAARASLVNSSLEPDEAARRLEAFARGGVKLLYAAPERLRQRGFVEALRGAGVGLVVVDEVHCVSMWGHDFRPDYFFIRAALAELGEPPLLGLTATATPSTEREIGSSLGRSFEVVRASVVRPNLRHAVDHVDGEEERRRALLLRLRISGGPAIVYARSRKKCEQLSLLLRGHGIDAAHYHAGLPSSERTATQEAFLSGDTRVVVATTAFGMGIDKPDIRLVVLYNYPGSLEDYVQMVGRAGRDGAASDCVLFAGRQDALALGRFVRSDVPSTAVLRSVYRTLLDAANGGAARLTAEELALRSGAPEGADPKVLVGMLEQVRLVARGYDAGRAMEVRLLETPPDAAERLAELLGRYERRALERVERIVRYAASARCRQAQIGEHFGEQVPDRCAGCDRCTPASRPEDAPAVERPLPDDVASAILEAVASLRWPLGRTGLVAALAGSVSAPPSARRNESFGLLSGARPAAIGRWIDRLVDSGHLEPYETEDGFRLLRLVRRDDPPRLAESTGTGPLTSADDQALFERLRTWRLERAREADVPAFVVFSDRTLRALAAARPADEASLAEVPGIGPAKLESYGDELLTLLAGSSD
jgi:ATP-dependent DNA helicase RecQ